MSVKATDLVQVGPLYYEFIDMSKGKRGSRKFWEIVPTKWDSRGYITSFATAWGRIGTKGSSAERQCVTESELDNLVRSKIRKGYAPKTRPEDRHCVKIDGLDENNMGIVVSVENDRHWNRIATILVDDHLVNFPVRFLRVVARNGE